MYFLHKFGDTNKEGFHLATLGARMFFNTVIQVDTHIGITIYKSDDNFMSAVRKELNLVLQHTVIDNMYFGRYSIKGIFVDQITCIKISV